MAVLEFIDYENIKKPKEEKKKDKAKEKEEKG
jgi:hypothetical protein